jgi:hypothetical protein
MFAIYLLGKKFKIQKQVKYFKPVAYIPERWLVIWNLLIISQYKTLFNISDIVS